DRALRCGHPLLGIHRGRCVDDEHDQVPDLALADLLPQVAPLELETLAREAAAILLHRGSSTDGSVDREIVDLRPGLRPHVTAATIGSLARRALAALLADPPLPGQVDALHVEGLGRVWRRLVAARATGGHPLVAARRLLSGVGGARALLRRRLRGRLAL